MSYNRNFTNLVSTPGRYNQPGNFVSAEQPAPPPVRTTRATAASFITKETHQATSVPDVNQEEIQQYPTNVPLEPKTETVDNSGSFTELNEDGTRKKPSWMKSGGVKKISNKERRRRQNEHLRRLLTPKNAIMVLNEMIVSEGQQPISTNCNIQSTDNSFFGKKVPTFSADFSIEGTNYRGFGDTKIAARNSAAEQAIRDLVIKRMKSSVPQEPMTDVENEDVPVNSGPVPMIQLASYALHKLFTEWQCDGIPTTIPQSMVPPGFSRPASAAPPAPPRQPPLPNAPKAPKQLPAEAATMHPCVLLCQMRPGLVYHELGEEGDRPQCMVYTMGVTVDGTTYIGKAGSKKEARKQAARSACQEIFKIQYMD